MISKGCSLQTFSSPVQNVIAFAVVKGEKDPVMPNTMELINRKDSVHESSRVQPVPKKKEWVNTSRRYDCLDLCNLGTKQLIDDEMVFISTLNKTAVRIRH